MEGSMGASVSVPYQMGHEKAVRRRALINLNLQSHSGQPERRLS